MDKYAETVAIELAEGFDRSVAEGALQDFMTAKLGGGVVIFESAAAGVIAMERLGWDDEKKVDWDEVSEALEKATGISVVEVDSCDWSFDDQCDEEATYLAFGIPSLEKGYAPATSAP